MPARERSSLATRAKGTWGRFGITYAGGQNVQGNNVCSDIIGPGDNAPLHVHHLEMDGGVINRPNTGFFSPWFSDYIADVFDNVATFDHLAISGSPSNVEAATRGAARTNPSRPYVDVPVNIFELGDVIRTVRRVGNGLFDTSLSSTGRSYLRYQFGVRPLVGDLVKLINFQDQVNRRVMEIERLKTRKGLRRTVGVSSASESASISLVVQSEGIFVVGNFDVETSEEVRVHTRWLPDIDTSSIATSASMRAIARRAVLGLTVDFLTLWEAMPWSWLIDWGSNIGDFFKAHRNIVPAVLSDISVMRHATTSYSYDGWTDGVASITPARVRRVDKRRANSFVAPSAHFPFLSAGQMGIVASLAATRL